MKPISQVFSILLIFAITWVTYSNHFYNAFHFDDEHTIVHNEYIRDIKNIPLFFKDGTTTSTLPANQSYRPGLTMLNTIDMYISGKEKPEPLVFHISIFISYLILGMLVYLLVLHILSIKSKNASVYPVALFTTAWFLLHTANSETINYIIARSDSFSTLAIILSFIIYIYFPAVRKWHFYLIPALAGFFVKEQTIMFLPILFIYKMLFEEGMSLTGAWVKRKKVFGIIKQLLIPLLILMSVFLFSRVMTPASWEPGELNRWRYLFTQPFVVFHYAYNFILPVNLVVDTDWDLTESFYDDKVLAGLLFVFSLCVAALRSSKSDDFKPVSFGICWFLIALVPTSSIFPFAEVLNDHRTFFPYIGLFISVAAMIKIFISSESFRQKRFLRLLIPPLAVIFLFLHARGTYYRNEIWHSEESLWKEATIKAPRNERAWMNFGLAVMAKGNYKEAEICYQKAKDLLPDYPYVYINLGIAKSKTGRSLEAEADFKKALSMDPRIPACYSFYARYLVETGRIREAKSLLERALSVSPQHAMLKELMAVVVQKSAEEVKAPNDRLSLAVQNASRNPTAESYINLSLEYYNAATYDSCIIAAREALKLKPGYDLAYNNLCAAYNRLKKWDEAIEAGEKGLKMNPANQLLKGNLDESYKEKHRK